MTSTMDYDMEEGHYNPLSLVPKSDLKTARLVCKAWRGFANALLFETVYISANQEDLDVFVGIAGSEELRGCVKRVVYDASAFTPSIPRRTYLNTLTNSWKPFVKLHSTPPPFSTTSTQTLSFLSNTPPTPPSPSHPEKVQWLRYKLEYGYETYTQHATLQQTLISSPEFSAALLYGLGRFSNLEDVEFGYQWTSYADRVGLKNSKAGSPLMRRWNPWHCRPSVGFPVEEWVAAGSRVATNGAWHGRVLVDALVAANGVEGGGLLRGMKMRIGPVGIFDHESALGREIIRLGAVLGGIERFVLHVPAHVDALAENRPNVDALTHLLASMPKLQDLDLSLPTRNPLDDSDYMPFYYSLGELFPISTSWHKLETLRLRSVSATSATELLNCLKKQMPRLTWFTLGEMALYEGTWREVFEGLERTRQLEEFELEDGVVLWCNGARDTYVDALPPDIALDIESFVEAGGDNPFERMDRAQREELDQQYVDELFGSGMDTDTDTVMGSEDMVEENWAEEIDVDSSDTAEGSEL